LHALVRIRPAALAAGALVAVLDALDGDLALAFARGRVVAVGESRLPIA